MAEKAADLKPKYRHAACVWTIGDGSSRFSGPSRPSLANASTISKVRLVIKGKTGIKGFEFHYPNEIDEGNCKKLKRILDDNGMKTAMVTPNNHHHSVHRGLSSANRKERKACIERAKRTIDIAYEMGATVVVFWQGGEKYDDYTSIDFQEAIRYYVESANEIIRYDKEERDDKVVLAGEAKPNEPGRYMLLQTDSDFLTMRGMLEYPEKFKLNPETGHSEMIGLDPVQSLAWIMANDALAHYHINTQHGCKFDTDDQVNIDKTRLYLVKELITAGFSGFVGHDIQPRHNYSAEDNVRVIKDSVANCKKLEKLVAAIKWDKVSEMETAGQYLDAKNYVDKMLRSV